MSRAPIETEGLTKRYGDLTAVEDLTLQVDRRQVLGFLGPNGAGKSTTIKMLTGLVRPTEGDAWVHGHHVQRDGVAARERLGYLPEVVGLYEDMTGRQFLTYTGRFHGVGSSEILRRAEELLDRVGLREAGGRRIGGYSKGMRQRLALAGALFHDPDVLVLDEPLTGLDPEGVLGMRRAIRGLGEERTVFLCSHELHAVEALCDRAVIVDDGQVLADAPVDELTEPETPRVEVVLAPTASPDAAQRTSALAGVADVQGRKGSLVLTLEDGTDPETVLADLVEAGVPVRSFQPRRRSLEEAFADVTGVLPR